MTVANTVSGTTGVTLSVSGAGNSFIHSAGTISASNAAIAITADDFNLSSGASTIAAGNGSISFAQTTNGRPVDLGTNAAGSLGLVAAELLEPSTTGTFTVGNSFTGTVTVSSAVSVSNAPTLAITSGAAVSGGGAIGAGSLAVSAASGIALSGASSVPSVQLSNSGSGNVGYTGSSVGGAATLTVTGSDAAAGGTFTVQETSGALTVGAAGLSTHGGTISLTTLKAAGLLTISGTVDSTAAGLSPAGGDLTLVADDMSIGGALRAGTGGAFYLYPNNVARTISLGAGSSGLGLSNAELGNLYGQTGLTIGRATQTGQIQADGAVDMLTPAHYSGPIFLITTTGGIALSTYAITTPGNLSLSSVGAVTGSGQLTIGASGASSLSATSSNGISLSNAGNLANAVSLTNGNASGNILFYDNRNMTLTATNSFAGGTIAVVNGAGTMGTSGAISTTGPGAADISLQTVGALTISNPITAADTGYISLSAGSTTQTAILTSGSAGLLLLGAGPYSLTQANAVGLVAASITGASNALSFTSAGALSVGTVNGTSGITTTAGAVTLNTGAGAISLNYAGGPVISSSGGQIQLQRPVTLAANATVSSGAGDVTFSQSVDADAAGNNRTLTVDSTGATLFSGPVGGNQALASLTTDAGGSMTAANVTTRGSQLYHDASAAFTGTAYSTNDNGAGGLFQVDGPLSLQASPTVTTGAGNATFLGTVDADLAANNRSLTVDSSGTTSFSSTVGGAQSLASLTTDAAGTTSISANVTTSNGQTYNDPVTLYANILFTANAAQTVHFANTLDGSGMARTVRIVAANAQFDGAVGAANVQSLVVDGTTALNASVTTSGLQTYTGAVTLGADLSTTSGTGAIGFSSTVGQTGTRTLTVQNAASTGNVTFGGAVTLTGLATGAGNYAVAFNNGGTITNAVAFTNTGGVTIAAGLTANAGLTSTTAGTNTFQGTVATDGIAGHDISVSNLTVGGSGLTLNAGLANFLFSAIVNVGNVVSGAPPDPVDDPTDLTITAALIDGSVSGTLQLAQDATADIGASNFNIKTLTNPGQDVITNATTKTITRHVGIIRLTGTQTIHTISSAGYSTAGGAFLYYGSGGTIFTSGIVDTSAAPGPYNYWDLIIDTTGIFTPETDIVVHGSVRIRNGALSAGSLPARQITVGGNWRNDVDAAGFTAGVESTSVVSFLALTSPVIVWGSNNWYIFKCTAPGVTFLFENDKTQSIATGGNFWVKSAGASITLSRLTPGTLPLPNPTNNPGTPPANPGDDPYFWFFDLKPGASFTMGNVNVFYSNARDDPISVPAGVTATPYSTHYCYKWLDIAYSIYSYTEDTDYNGKIDRIRVTTESNIDTSLVNLSGFQVEVQGYDIDASKGTNGYAVPVSGYAYYIYLKEKTYNDTGVTPDWHIIKNTTFRDAGGKLIGTLSRAGGSDWMTPGDTAWPFVGYTLALPGQTTAFVHLSESVVQTTWAPTTAPAAVDLGFSGGLSPITTSGVGIQEATGTAPTPPTVANIYNASNKLALTGTLRDMGHAPYWEPAYNGQVIGAPNPSYPPATGYAADPNSYALAAGQTDLDRYNANPFELRRGGAAVGYFAPNIQHRVSDLMVSLPPPATGAYDPLTYFAWPIYAKDQVALSLSDADIAALTPAQTAAEGIGLIRAFDGSQWLRPQNITLQTRVSASLGLTPTLVYDSGVAASYKGAYGVWLPFHLETSFSGIDGHPDLSTHSNGVPSPVAGGLWDFALASTDSKIQGAANGSAFDFFYQLSSAPGDLYVGRLDIPSGSSIPADWYRRVKPFSFGIHNVALQKGGATILNNVIDPTKGETARLSYQLASAGSVTVTVFTLDGDVVARLVNTSSQAAGDHAVSWNGRNLSGSAVARGLYFIRIVAPGMDEIRKVLVVRK
jgi:hypothetical protein